MGESRALVAYLEMLGIQPLAAPRLDAHGAVAALIADWVLGDGAAPLWRRVWACTKNGSFWLRVQEGPHAEPIDDAATFASRIDLMRVLTEGAVDTTASGRVREGLRLLRPPYDWSVLRRGWRAISEALDLAERASAWQLQPRSGR